PVQSLAAAVQRHARTRTADRAEAPHSSALPHGGGGTVARELGYPYRAVRTVATMIQASEYLNAQLHELHVEPAYERRLRVLLEYCRRGLPSVDETMLRRAFGIAYWAHRDDRRASGERYISHPLEVATIVARDVPFDDVSVAAALLHDTVEDTDLSLELLEAEFGREMALIIDGLTKIDHVFESRELGQAENVRKLMLSMASDIRVIIVKFADRLHNMRTLGSLPQRKQLKIASETQDLFVPLAHRFGLNEVKTELEELCLKYIQPEAYQASCREREEVKM